MLRAYNNYSNHSNHSYGNNTRRWSGNSNVNERDWPLQDQQRGRNTHDSSRSLEYSNGNYNGNHRFSEADRNENFFFRNPRETRANFPFVVDPRPEPPRNEKVPSSILEKMDKHYEDFLAQSSDDEDEHISHKPRRYNGSAQSRWNGKDNCRYNAGNYNDNNERHSNYGSNQDRKQNRRKNFSSRRSLWSGSNSYPETFFYSNRVTSTDSSNESSSSSTSVNLAPIMSIEDHERHVISIIREARWLVGKDNRVRWAKNWRNERPMYDCLKHAVLRREAIQHESSEKHDGDRHYIDDHLVIYGHPMEAQGRCKLKEKEISIGKWLIKLWRGEKDVEVNLKRLPREHPSDETDDEDLMDTY